MVAHARAVIIGGGVGGTSIAYHLAALGWTDIVLLDRAELTSGSTFHSAGLVGQLRSTVTLTRMMMYGVELYRRLADETGVDPSWHEVGSLRLASSPARYEELQRQAGWAASFGLPIELIPATEARDRFPLMSTDGVLGAVWLPTDGWLDPSNLAFALAAGRPEAGGDDPQPSPRRRDRRARRAGDGRRRGARRRAVDDRGRGRGQRRRHVRARDRPPGRDHAADHPDGPPVPAHRADRGRRARPAPAPRPGQPRVLPRGGRWPVHGRLRAEPDALGARRRPARLQPPPARPRLAPVRGDHGRRHPPGPRDRRRARDEDDQRSRRVHAGQRVHPR